MTVGSTGFVWQVVDQLFPQEYSLHFTATHNTDFIWRNEIKEYGMLYVWVVREQFNLHFAEGLSPHVKKTEVKMSMVESVPLSGESN